MKAHVEAAAARLHVTDQGAGAVALQTSVLLESRQPIPIRDREPHAFENGARRWTPSTARAPQRLGQRFVDALLHTSISTFAPVTRTG